MIQTDVFLCKDNREVLEQDLKLAADFLCKNAHLLSDKSLYWGSSGVALFLSYCGKFFKDERYSECSIELITDAVSVVSSEVMRFDFPNGITGIYWAFVHILKMNGYSLDEIDTALEETDDAIFSYLYKAAEKEHFFLNYGLTGGLLYLLERPNKSKFQEVIGKIMESVSDKKYVFENADFVSWKNDTDFDSNVQGTVFSLGLLNGVSGLTTIMGLILKKEYQIPELEKLILQAADWLWASKYPQGFGSFFPPYTDDFSDIFFSSPMGWLNGDNSVAGTFWQIGDVTGQQIWKDRAIEVFLESAKRKRLDSNSVFDASLISGTAGIAYSFYLMGLRTQSSQWYDLAEHWLNIGYVWMPKFQDIDTADFSTEEDKRKIGLMSGISGVGLVAMSMLDNSLTGWERCILLS